MKAFWLTLIVLAGCAGSPQPNNTRLTGERDSACATCPPDCCTAEQAKTAAKSECCTAEQAKTAAKSECCAAEQAKTAAKSECCTAADSVTPKPKQ